MSKVRLTFQWSPHFDIICMLDSVISDDPYLSKIGCLNPSLEDEV